MDGDKSLVHVLSAARRRLFVTSHPQQRDLTFDRQSERNPVPLKLLREILIRDRVPRSVNQFLCLLLLGRSEFNAELSPVVKGEMLICN